MQPLGRARHREARSPRAIISACVAMVAVAACGGGGGGGSNSSSPPPPQLAACTSLASNLKLEGSANPPGCASGACSSGFAFQLLVLDNSNVYWFEYDATNGAATGGSIRTVPKAGGSVTTVVSGLRGVNNFVIDDSNVYWTEYDIVQGNGSIKTVPKLGGPVTVLATGTPPNLTTDVFFPTGIAVDSTFVYWTDFDGPIRRIPKSGGIAIDLSTAGGGLRTAIDAGSTYLYANGGSNPGQGATIARYPLSGGAAQILATGVGSNSVGGIALDDQYLYGVAVDAAPKGSVFEVPIGGGAPIYVAPNQNDPQNVAIDANFIYYISQNRVNKIPKAGGTPTAYSNCSVPNMGTSTNPLLSLVNEVAVDNTDVYVMGVPFGQNSDGRSPGELAKFPK